MAVAFACVAAGLAACGDGGNGGGSHVIGVAGSTGTGRGGASGAAGAALAGRGGGTAGAGGVTTSGTAGTGGSGAGGRGPTWTVLVYANGDSNIGANLFRDIVEMASAVLTPDIGLYVYADYPAGDPIPGTTERFPSGTELMRVLGSGDIDTLATKAEEDFDNPNTLTAAITSVFGAHPADHYGLILWDHGGAWRYGFGGDTQNGARAGRPMAVETVAGAVRAGLAGANLSGRPPLDFLAFDTCLLGGPEIAAPLADTARVYIADAELDYGDGWDYERTLTWLSDHAGASVVDFARQEVLHWDAHHSSGVEDMLFKSHVALDLSAFPAFTTAMAALVTATRGSASTVSVARSFDTALPDYYVESAADESSGPIPLKDVGQILASLAQDPSAPVASAASAARTALGSLVLARAMGAARSGQAGLNLGAGIPIEFTPPMTALYRQLLPTWNGATRWADLVDTIRAGADATGPTISSTGFANNSVPFTINDADLLYVDVNAWSFSTDKSVLFLLQLLNRYYLAPGSYQFNWTGKVIAISATPAPVLVSLLPWREVAGTNGVQIPIFKSPGFLKEGTSSFYTELLIDVANLRAESAVVTIDGLPQVFSIADVAGPGVTFTPLFVYADIASGTADFTTGPTSVSIAGTELTFTAATLTPGSYAFSLDAKDTWGNSATKAVTFDLP